MVKKIFAGLAAACCLSLSIAGFTATSVAAKAESVVEMPSSINMTVMNATKANPFGAIEVLPKEQVEGAENDVLWYSNKNLKLSDSSYRWSYLNLRIPVTPGEEYTFDMRVKVFTGEDVIGKPPTLNSFWTQFSTMSSIVYNAAANNAFVRFLNGENGVTVNKLGDMCNNFSLGDTTAAANTSAAINGEWITLGGKFTVPETSPYNGTAYATTDLVLSLRLESGSDDASATRNMYIDRLTVTSAKPQPLNLATSSDYWKSGSGERYFGWGEDGMSIIGNLGATSTSMLLYPRVPGSSTLTYTIESTLADPSDLSGYWGNAYIIFKNMNENPVSDTGLESKGGNYVAFQFGSDNPWIIECIDGAVEKLPANGTVDNNDIWYWYAGTTTVSITTVDTEDGFSATILLKGKSGNTSRYDYVCYDERFIGDYATGIEFFCSAMSTPDNYIKVSSVTISDVFELEVNEADVAALNASVAAVETVGAENYDLAVKTYDDALAAYADFNFTQRSAFDKDALDSLGGMIAAYDAAVTEAQAVAALIDALPTTITEDNYEQVKAAITSAEEGYAALSPTAALVDNYGKIAECSLAVSEYEKSLETESGSVESDGESGGESADESESLSEAPNDSETESTTKKKSSGCKSSAGAVSGALALLALGAALVVKRRV